MLNMSNVRKRVLSFFFTLLYFLRESLALVLHAKLVNFAYRQLRREMVCSQSKFENWRSKCLNLSDLDLIQCFLQPYVCKTSLLGFFHLSWIYRGNIFCKEFFTFSVRIEWLSSSYFKLFRFFLNCFLFILLWLVAVKLITS